MALLAAIAGGVVAYTGHETSEHANAAELIRGDIYQAKSGGIVLDNDFYDKTPKWNVPMSANDAGVNQGAAQNGIINWWYKMPIAPYRYVYLNKDITCTWENVGFDDDGDRIDVRLTYLPDTRWWSDTITSQWVLLLQQWKSDDSGRWQGYCLACNLWDDDKNHITDMTDNPNNQCADFHLRIEFFKTGTEQQQIATGEFLNGFNDLDQPGYYWKFGKDDRWCESVELISGHGTVYIPTDNFLYISSNRNGEPNTDFRATRNDSDSYNSGFVTNFTSGAEFWHYNSKGGIGILEPFESKTIRVIENEGGTIQSKGRTGDISVGWRCDRDIVINTDIGYTLKDVIIDGEHHGAITTYSFSNVTEDHTVEAIWEKIPPINTSISIEWRDDNNRDSIRPAADTILNVKLICEDDESMSQTIDISASGAPQEFAYPIAEDNPNKFPKYTVNSSVPGYTFEINSSTIIDGIVIPKIIATHIPVNRVISFDGNGADSGQMEPITRAYDTEITLPPSSFHRNGYYFAGWNTTPDGSGKGYKPESCLPMFSEDTILYAQWKPTHLSSTKRFIPSTREDGTFIPNQGEITIDVEGESYPVDRHLILVMDRTGSLTQPVYDEIEKNLQDAAEELIQTGHVKVSCVLYSGVNSDPTSDYWDGYHIPFIDTANASDLDKMKVPVSMTFSGVKDGVNYGNEQGGTSWHSGFLGLEEIMEQVTQTDSNMCDIIFFSDGDTQAIVDSTGKCVSAPSTEVAYDYGKNTLDSIMSSYHEHISSFTVIGLEVFNSNLTNMSSLTEQCLVPYAPQVASSVHIRPDSASVSQELAKSIKENTTAGASNVSIIDSLSENVSPMSRDELDRPSMKVTMSKDGEGQDIEENIDYTYEWNEETNTIIINKIGQLKHGESMSIRVPVYASDTAFAKETSGEPSDIGEDGTGEFSQGIPGRFTNKGNGDMVSSNTPYGDFATSTLPNPVIQLSLATITYDANCPDATGKVEAQTVGVNKGIIIQDNGFERDKYVFKGWSLSSGDNTDKIDLFPGDTIAVAQDTTLYAVWTYAPIEMPDTGMPILAVITFIGILLITSGCASILCHYRRRSSTSSDISKERL